MYSLSPDEFLLLANPETALLVEKHLDDDPAQLAFRLKGDREQARLICQQVKFLQRAKKKLPSFYAARCIIPPLSYEQCSSEAAAGIKTDSGSLCIDLTCGLGVDSFFFSKSFQHVITIERDPVLAEVARHNFALLGAENIMVKNSSAEVFLASYNGPKADLIYIDPSRRNEGQKVFLLEDCSPNIVEILPQLLNIAKKVWIKLSPLFDIEEALRIFSEYVSEVKVVSIGGEVKELMVELSPQPEKTEIVVRSSNGQCFSFGPNDISHSAAQNLFVPNDRHFLLIPDPAFYKARLAQALLHKFYAGLTAVMPDQNGFVFSAVQPEHFPGRVYRIKSMEAYQPKTLKKSLKKQRVKRINILRRSFPYQSAEIKQALGVQEGGAVWLAFTEIDGRLLVFQVEPVK